MKPYFRFSEYQKTDIGLGSWLNHFKEQGIPAAIIKGWYYGKPVYAVWRWGTEHGHDANTEEARGEVMDEVLGFGGKLTEGGGVG